MTKRENFIEAFQLLERYNQYKLKKSWGWMLVVFGLFYLFVFIFSFYLREIGNYIFPGYLPLIAMLSGLFFMLLPIVTLFTFYKFISLKKPLYNNGQLLSRYNIYLGLAFFSMLFFSIHLDLFFIFSSGVLFHSPTFTLFSLFNVFLLNGALGFLVSYLLLDKKEFKEHLLIGLVLLILSVIMGLWAHAVFYQIRSLISTAEAHPLNYNPTFLALENLLSNIISYYPLTLNLICYLSCGFYQIISASKNLRESNGL